MNEDLIASASDKMEKALSIVQEDLATVRTGRASPKLLENIIISAYGGSQHLKLLELATITVSEPQTLIITPFDETIIEEIERGIAQAGLGFMPKIEGGNIRVKIPPLSEERRKEYLKLAKAKLEAGKVMIRQIRHDLMTKIKRMAEGKEINEDERKNLEKELQKITDEMVAEIEMMGKKKEEELTRI